MLTFLAIDDSPGRFDELSKIIDGRGHRLVITHDPELSLRLAALADAILLDHDMPGPDGRARARELVSRPELWKPVVIVSTSGIPGVREEMERTFRDAGWPVFLCPADHMHCEIEWVAWVEGAVEGVGARP